MKIEGLGQLDDFYFITSKGEALEKITIENMKVGKLINGAGNNWIITDVLGEGKFKAVPKNRFDNWKIPSKVPEALKEIFDISGKVDAQHFVYKLNEEAIPREARKMGLEVIGKIKEGAGEYWKILIPKERARMPIEAFSIVPFIKSEQE